MSKVQAIGIDAHEIIPDLWQGSKPVKGSYLSSLGFKSVILCAVEYQPNTKSFPGLKVVKAAFDDDVYRPIDASELEVAQRAAESAARMVEKGLPTLVTCFAGLNRSGLVTALAAHKLTGMSGNDLIQLIQSKRSQALFNPGFLAILRALPEVKLQRT